MGPYHLSHDVEAGNGLRCDDTGGGPGAVAGGLDAGAGSASAADSALEPLAKLLVLSFDRGMANAPASGHTDVAESDTGVKALQDRSDHGPEHLTRLVVRAAEDTTC